VIAASAAGVVVLGYVLGRDDAALVALMLGAAESTLRPAYHRALLKKVREISH
jgi:hypothetical protein